MSSTETESRGTAPSAESARIERDAYTWNTVGGLLMAFQSVIMLMVLTRVCDVATAGVFTLAYANANLFLNLGKYGVRNFQVSDVRGRFRFGSYLRARIVTSVAMIAFGAVYLIWSALTVGYSTEKFLTVLVMLAFKAVDALEDVFHGNYQQHGRLDVGAKVLTLRLATSIVVFAGLIVALRGLLVPLAVTTVYTALFFVCETVWARRKFNLPVATRRSDADGAHGGLGTGRLLRECFPVFLAVFLLFYIGNAPKYAIDAAMDDAAQAYYGYIAMPVFVVGLLAGFIYNPIIGSLSEDWARGRVGKFAKRFAVQSVIIVGITLVCVVGALVCGIPVLGALYNADLSPYRADLLILLAGGGMLALTTLFTTGITIIRRQRMLMPGYVAVAALAALVSPAAVQAGGIRGASLIYLALMTVLTVWFGVVFAIGARRGRA